MKRKWIILPAVALIVLAMVVWGFTPSDSHIIIKGNLSASDISQIKSAVRDELKAAMIPPISLKSIKYLPGGISRYVKTRILSIESRDLERAFAEVALDGVQSSSNKLTYIAVKETNGWRLQIMEVKTGDHTFQMMTSTNHFLPAW